MKKQRSIAKGRIRSLGTHLRPFSSTPFDQARDLHRAGKLDDARRGYLKVLESQPQHIEALQLLAVLYNRTREYESALQVVGRAISLNANVSSLFKIQGDALRGLRNFSDALACYDKALAIDQRYAEACNGRGITLHDLGRIDEAVAAFQRGLLIKPGYVDVLVNMGVSFKLLGRFADALDCFDRALAFAPNHFAVLNNRGNLLRKMGRVEEAVASFNAVLRVKPDYVEALNNRGVALQAQGAIAEAFESYSEALRLRPTYVQAILNRGNLYFESGQIESALRDYDHVITIDNVCVDAYVNKAIALKSLRRLDEALEINEIAVQLSPHNFNALNNRGVTLLQLKRFPESLASFKLALVVKPDSVDALFNQGNALQEMKLHSAALSSFGKALELDPEHSGSWNNRSVSLLQLRRCKEALFSCEQALRIRPDYADAHNNRGNVFKEERRFDDAINSYGEAVRINPFGADAIYNRSLLYLLLCRFKEGFGDYSFRWKSKNFPSLCLDTSISKATSENLANGHILFWAEQGLGDEVFYSGLLPLLVGQVDRVSLAVDKRLHPIFERSFTGFNLLDHKELVSRAVHTGFDAQAPIGDLGHLLDLDETKIRATRKPFLKADAERVESIRTVAPFNQSELICGIAWKSANKDFGSTKSIELDQIGRALRTEGVSFVNLQYGAVEEEIRLVRNMLGIDIRSIEHFDLYADIDGLLALIEACDVVITTSNVTAHLAGAIGKPSAVIIPYGLGRIWYWHHEQQLSLWYPNTRLFYQENPLDWFAPLKGCAAWLGEMRK